MQSMIKQRSNLPAAQPRTVDDNGRNASGLLLEKVVERHLAVYNAGIF